MRQLPAFRGVSLSSAPWLPSQLSGFVSEFNVSRALATGNLWQNTAETVPAVANNDPVRVLVDPLSGVKYTAPSDAARGLLKSSGGYSWIEMDGVDDWVQQSTLSPDTCTIGLSFSTDAGTNRNRGIYSSYKNTASGFRGTYFTPRNSTFGGGAKIWVDNNLRITTPTLVQSNVWSVSVATHSEESFWRLDGVLQGSIAEGATNSEGDPFVLGRSKFDDDFSSCKIACFITYSRVLNENEIIQIETYLASLRP